MLTFAEVNVFLANRFWERTELIDGKLWGEEKFNWVSYRNWRIVTEWRAEGVND